MAHSELQKLQKSRAYFKWILSGMFKPLPTEAHLTSEERRVWGSMQLLQKMLLANIDTNSRILGLNVPEFRCDICNKEAHHFEPEDTLCKKHYKEYCTSLHREE